MLNFRHTALSSRLVQDAWFSSMKLGFKSRWGRTSNYLAAKEMIMNIQDKKLMLGELRYELEMFNKTSEHFIELPKRQENNKQEDETERRAYLESFLLHTRNIVDFLEDFKNADDIRCSDFGIEKVSISLPQNNTKMEINKYLMHITKQRIKKQSPELWQYGEIKNEIHRHLKNFIKQLPIDCFPNSYGSKADFESLLNTSMPETPSN